MATQIAHDALDDLHRRNDGPASIRIIYETALGRGGEVEIIDEAASARASAVLRALPHYADSDLTLTLPVDDVLRALAR